MKRKIDVSTLLKNLLAYIIIFLVLIIEGCFNFVELKFNVDAFYSIEFWAETFFRVFLLVVIRIAAMLIFLDIARAKNMDLRKAKEINDKYMKLKGDDFSEYMETVKNPSIKIKAWKEQVNKKLAKLEKKAKQEDRSLYYKKGEEYKLQKENNEYCKQRKLLEEQLSNEYIKESIETLIIRKKYPKIDPTVFSLPVTVENLNKQYQITAKTKNAIISSIAISSSMAIIWRTIIQSLQPQPTEVYMLGVIINIIADLIFIIIQFWSGIIGAFSKIQSEEVTPYINRNEILKEYLHWKNPGNPDTFAKWLTQLEELNIQDKRVKPEA